VDKRVDIICIPIGISTCPDELRKAVEKAARERVLIFASAARGSGNIDTLYPARMHNVFRMFSTDGCLKISSFNPPPRNSTENFAVLGEEVAASTGKRPIYGTSVSTAIAAGISGMLLDFARQPDARTIINDEALRTKEGMTAIFKLMSRHDRDSGYYCLAPWILLPPDYTRQDRKTIRHKISWDILTALKHL
jgi:hypothetical protein